jgi:hypothetical protein
VTWQQEIIAAIGIAGVFGTFIVWAIDLIHEELTHEDWKKQNTTLTASQRRRIAFIMWARSKLK